MVESSKFEDASSFNENKASAASKEGHDSDEQEYPSARGATVFACQSLSALRSVTKAEPGGVHPRLAYSPRLRFRLLSTGKSRA